MYSPTPRGSDWLKHISTIMWGTSINRPWIPLKCLPTVPFTSSSQPPFLCANRGKRLLVDTCISLTLWQSFTLASSPSQKLWIILISILSPLFLISLCQWVKIVSQFCHVSGLTLLALQSLITSSPSRSAHHHSTCRAIFPPSIPIIPFNPSQSLSLALPWLFFALCLSYEDKTWHQ